MDPSDKIIERTGLTLTSAPDPDEQDISEALAATSTSDVEAEKLHAEHGMQCPPEKAAQICRQVDYYFSKQNLETDNFLHKRIKGSKNRAMRLSDIAGFKKMQPFHPIEHIFSALKHGSQMVNVFVDNSTELMIQRKEIFHKTPAKASAVGPVKAKAKAASGFEEYFADAPTTPQAADEERQLYDPENSIAERMEHAVKRYRTRRKMDSFTSNAFLKWMAYGGMYLGPVPYGGGPDPSELENMTAKQKKEANVTVYAIGGESDDYGDALWEVSFSDVARSFLSRHVFEVLELEDRKDVDRLVNIMHNFYRYLQQHDVCPEYISDINVAKLVCNEAQEQLPHILELGKRLPGPFNIAASMHWKGQWSRVLAYGAAGEQDTSYAEEVLGFSPDKVIPYLKTAALSFFPHRARYFESDAEQLIASKVVKTWEDVALRVSEFSAPDDDQRQYFEAGLKKLKDRGIEINAKAVGACRCFAWHPPDFAEWDLPPGVSPHAAEENQIFDLVIDEALLKHFFVGLKFKATIRQIGFSLCFMDTIDEVLPSYELQLCNELVLKQKEVHWYTNEELREMDGKAVEDGQENDSEEVESDD